MEEAWPLNGGVSTGSKVAEVKAMPVVAPIMTERVTRAELSKVYPRIQSDFRKFEVRITPSIDICLFFPRVLVIHTLHVHV